MKSKKPVVDTEKLSKKYRTSVDRVIKAWKKGMNDLEISSNLNIDLIKLQQLRGEIEQAHNRARSDSKTNAWLKL